MWNVRTRHALSSCFYGKKYNLCSSLSCDYLGFIFLYYKLFCVKCIPTYSTYYYNLNKKWKHVLKCDKMMLPFTKCWDSSKWIWGGILIFLSRNVSDWHFKVFFPESYGSLTMEATHFRAFAYFTHRFADRKRGLNVIEVAAAAAATNAGLWWRLGMDLGPIFKHHHRPALAPDARCGYSLSGCF